MTQHQLNSSHALPRRIVIVLAALPAALPASSLVIPALLDCLAHTLSVLPAVVLVEVGRFDVGGRGGVRVVE